VVVIVQGIGGETAARLMLENMTDQIKRHRRRWFGGAVDHGIAPVF
jgi:hypothetical protein